MSKNMLKILFWPKNHEKCSNLYVELKFSAILNIQDAKFKYYVNK